MRPFLTVRFGRLPSARLGHFTCNVELSLLEQQLVEEISNTKTINVWFCCERICNYALYQKWRERILIIPNLNNKTISYALSDFLVVLERTQSKLPFLSAFLIGTNLQHDRDILGLLQLMPTSLTFSAAEKLIGWNYLESRGLKPKQNFVVFTIRDSSYLRQQYPSSDFSYHDYRDSSLESYYRAMVELADSGLLVFRVGATVEKRVELNHPNIIDYATNGDRTEFLDLFLGAHCMFCVSQGTGYDGIPKIFRRPIVFVNVAPVGYLHTELGNSYAIFKNYRYSSSKKYLTHSEISQLGASYYLTSEQYEQAGIELVENTEEDIAASCTYALDQLTYKSYKTSQSDTTLLKSFWTLFNSREEQNSDRLNRLHGRLSINVNPIFLEKYKHWAA